MLLLLAESKETIKQTVSYVQWEKEISFRDAKAPFLCPLSKYQIRGAYKSIVGINPHE